jgi:heat shock protein HspQ
MQKFKQNLEEYIEKIYFNEELKKYKNPIFHFQEEDDDSDDCSYPHYSDLSDHHYSDHYYSHRSLDEIFELISHIEPDFNLNDSDFEIYTNLEKIDDFDTDISGFIVDDP